MTTAPVSDAAARQRKQARKYSPSAAAPAQAAKAAKAANTAKPAKAANTATGDMSGGVAEEEQEKEEDEEDAEDDVAVVPRLMNLGAADVVADVAPPRTHRAPDWTLVGELNLVQHATRHWGTQRGKPNKGTKKTALEVMESILADAHKVRDYVQCRFLK